MKNAISNGALVAMAAGAMLFSSCGDKDLYNSNYKYEEYAANWESRFGQIDPNQDWSMATTVTATVNVGREGTFSVKVYSSDPSDDTQQAYLLGKAVVEGGSPVTLTFDAAKNLDNVYVALITEQNLGIIKKVAIENGNVNADFFITSAAKAKTRTAADFGYEVTNYRTFTKDELNEILANLPEEVSAVDKFNNYEFVSNGEFIIYPVYGQTNAKDEIGYYYYDPDKGIDTKEEKTFITDITTLGDFTRYHVYSYNDYDLSDYLYSSLVKDIFNVDTYWSDKEPGHIESIDYLKSILENSFTDGGTTDYNGKTVQKYYYNKLVGETITDNNNNGTIIEAPYVMVNQNDVKYTVSCWTICGWAGGKYRIEGYGDWTSWRYSGNSVAKQDPETQAWSVDETQLTELQAKGYAINIPAGYRVGFWVKNGNNKMYSNRVLNEDGLYYSAVKQHENGDMYFGLEDWKYLDADKGTNNLDCNDIVFFVKNAGDNKLPEPVKPTPTIPDNSEDVPMSWLLACEDLGSTDDYDFNDIVVEVSRVDSDTNNDSKLIVKCLAAGGTLPANIYYNTTFIGESHDMLGSESTTQMINTVGGITKTSKEVEITDGITQNWTLSDNIHNFKIVVTQEGGDAKSEQIKAPTAGEVPQMLILPGKWEWPTERTSIEDAYPYFTNWSADATLKNWEDVKVDEKVIKRR